MRITSETVPTPILPAFLTSPLPANIIDKLRADFAAASFAHTGSPQVRLAVRDEPRFYDKSAEEIRAVLDEESPDLEAFVLVGPDLKETGAVWYVGAWAEDDEMDGVVRDGDERVLWKLRTTVSAVPSRWVDYSIGNSSIQEDIQDTLSTDLYEPHAPQTPYTLDQPAADLPDWMPPAYVVAGPGEWEEGDGALLDVAPPQDKVYRLKPEVAAQYGLRSAWAVGWAPKPEEGEEEGSMCFAQDYDVPRAS